MPCHLLARRLGVLLGLTLPLLPGCKPALAPPVASADHVAEEPAPLVAPSFEDVTTAAGIQFVHRNGEEAGHRSILESLGGGVAMFDFDRDGRLDLFFTGGGHFGEEQEILPDPCRLYRNEGGWRFCDVTASTGLDAIPFWSQGCASADYDNDGWPDLLVTGYGRLALFHNDRGQFNDATAAAGLSSAAASHWSTGASWGDLNGDGRLDLYVAQYVDWSFKNHQTCRYSPDKPKDVCPPRSFPPMPQLLYLNLGQGNFKEATELTGSRKDYGLGVLIFDVNHDGQPDLYMANDTTDNLLYLNRGGRLEEQGALLGVARDANNLPNGSMGLDAAAYDGSGHFSIFVTNYQHEAHALYRNRGQGPFYNASHQAGLVALGLTYVGFGTGFIDYDLDGNEDLFIVNGHLLQHPPPPLTVKQKPLLLHNTRQPGSRPHEVQFKDVSRWAGLFFEIPRIGRGAALGDLDNDGKIDLVVSCVNEPAVLLRNTTATPSHWVGFELVGNKCKEPIAAEVILQVGDRALARQVKSGVSYFSSCDRRVVFGLGTDDQYDQLTVRWPWGQAQTWHMLAADRYWRLTEGRAEAEACANPDRQGGLH